MSTNCISTLAPYFEVTDSLSGIQTRLISTWDEWSALEPEWNILLKQSMHVSAFMTFEYLRNGWKYFHSKNSNPFIICIYDDNKLIGIAPFRSTREQKFFFTYKLIEFICTWEMDKPYILTPKNYEQICWHAIVNFLQTNTDCWDELNIDELPIEYKANQILKKEFTKTSFKLDVYPGATGVWINLQKSWEEFKRGHKNFNNKLNKLEKLPNGYKIVRYTTPNDIASAIDAYKTIEANSWKNEKLGISKDKIHYEFYKQALIELAKNNYVSIHLLKTGDEIIAGDISYQIGTNVYFQHTVYNKKYRHLSPGKLLVRLVIKSYLESNAEYGDFLCGFSGYLDSWGDGTIKTENITVKKNTFSNLLYRISNTILDFS